MEMPPSTVETLGTELVLNFISFFLSPSRLPGCFSEVLRRDRLATTRQRCGVNAHVVLRSEGADGVTRRESLPRYMYFFFIVPIYLPLLATHISAAAV